MENFLELLKQRRTSRVFTGELIDKETVCNLMRAVLMSPSGRRINPWEFVLVEDKAMLKALSQCKEHGAGLIEGAAMAVVVIGDTTKTDVWIEDCSIATIIMQLAAEEYGLVAVGCRCACARMPMATLPRTMCVPCWVFRRTMRCSRLSR